MSIEAYVIQIIFRKIIAKVQFCFLVKNLFDKQYEKLVTAYKKAIYRCVDPELIVQIGEINREVNNFMTMNNYDKFCILTAHNPASKIQTFNENQQSQNILVNELEKEGFNFRYGVNSDPDGSFPDEDTCWVLGMTRDEGLLYSNRWGQNAFVYYSSEGKPELVWVKSKDE